MTGPVAQLTRAHDGRIRPLLLGTRRSALALAQSRLVAGAISAGGRRVRLVEVTTEGDRNPAPLAVIGGSGVFVSALRDALLRGEVDLAVHSFKDLPTAPAPGLVVAAVPERQDPRDALVAAGGLLLRDLPPGSTVGTGSPRRAAQLAALGLGLEVVPIRGNVDSRLRKVTEGELDAVVVAAAGLARLGRLGEASELLDPMLMLPAPAQGALAVECRADDEPLRVALEAVDDPATRMAVAAERALLSALDAGCSAPAAGLAEVAGDGTPGDPAELYLRGSVTAPDGSVSVRLSATTELPLFTSLNAGPVDRTRVAAVQAAAEALGRRLAADLIAEGADHLMGSTA